MKKAIACLFALSIPCWATNQYIFGSQADVTVPTTAQAWIGLMPRNDVSVWAANANTGTSYALMPTTGTFSTFCVNLTTAPGTGASWTWALYKNGSDQAITLTISAAQTQACDSTHTSGFLPGDLVALHVTPSTGPAPKATFASWYIVQTPQTSGETILFTSQQAASSQYLSLGGNSSSSSTEQAVATIIPAAGTVTKFAAEYVGPSSTPTVVLDRNESSASISISLTHSGVYVEQTTALSVSPGDVLDINETGITVSSGFYASIVFVPSVTGQFVIPTWRGIESNNQATGYFVFSGRSDDTLQTAESLAQQIGGNIQIQGIYARTTVAPGTGAQYTYTLRDHAANTTMSATMSGTNLAACMNSFAVTGCATGSAVAVNNFDLVDASVVPSGSPAVSGNNGVAVSYLAYVPQLVFTTQPPATGTAGTALGVVVQLQDANGNAITGSTAQVTIASTPAGVGGTVTVNSVNGVATFSNLTFNTAGSYTLSAAVSGLTTVTSSSISIGAGSANKLAFTMAPSSGTAGMTLSPAVVQVEDGYGNLISGSSAQVTIGSMPAGVGGTLTANAVNGVATFSNLLINTSGTYTLSAAAIGLAGATSGSISVGAGAANKLAITTAPSSGTAGTALSSVVVHVEDMNGNLATGSSAQVTIGSTPAGVSGTLTANAVNGVATFSNLHLNTSGTYTLSAAATGLASAATGSISIGPGMASKLVFTTQPPSTGLTTVTISPVSVQVQDANGNLVTGSSAQVTIGSNPSGVSGTLTANAVSGVASFSNLVFNSAGTYALSAASTGLASGTSNSILINVATTSIGFVTSPAGLLVSVDGGTAQAAPFTLALTWTSHTIAVASIQANGTASQYVFTGWSDSGSASHSITVNSSPATYTATFKTQYKLTTAASPAAGGTITPATGAYYDAGSQVSIQESANSGYQFSSFSGALTGSTNPQNVTINGPTNVVANFTPLAPNLATSGATATIVNSSTVSVSLTLTNTGLGPATNATITSITGVTDVGGTGAVSWPGSAVNLGTIAAGASATGTLTFSWPSTATRVKFTVNFTASGGYTGSTTVTIFR